MSAYRTVTMDGREVFYRKAGDPPDPTLLLHLLDTGHFATATHSAEIAEPILAFVKREMSA